MNNKTLATILIALCTVSIIIGLFKTASIRTTSGSEVSDGSSSNINSFLGESNKIALIALDGEISSGAEGYFGDKNSADSVRKALKRAQEDNSVKGVLLKVNSPGGTVGLSQEIYSLILKIRQEKPVVVSMTDIAASGGYYISSAADRIYAEPGTLTGSIGVIMSSLNTQGLANKLGIQSVVIKSGKFKDIGSSNKPMSKDEKELLQNIVNNTYKQFVDAIIQGRVNRHDAYSIKKVNLALKTLKENADGRVFTGQQAFEIGLVDDLGGIYDAHSAVSKMAKEKYHLLSDKIPLVSYNIPTGFSELLFGATESLVPSKGITSALRQDILPMSQKYPHQPLLVWE